MPAPTVQTIHAGVEPLLLYVLIIVVWAVAKKIRDLVRKDRPDLPPGSEAPPDQGRPKIDPTLQEFLETLTGQKIERPPERPAQPPPQPPPRVRMPAARAAPSAAPPPRHRAEPRPAVLEPARYERPDLDDERVQAPAKPLVAPHTERTILGAASSLAGIQTPLTPMPSMQLPTVRMNTDYRHVIGLRKPGAMRRAMVERIVLGAPRAMGVDPEERQMGWM